MRFALAFVSCILGVAASRVAACAADPIAFSGAVDLGPTNHEPVSVSLYRGNAKTDPAFPTNRTLIATTSTDSDGRYIFFLTSLPVSDDVTIRAKSAATHLGGDAVIAKPTASEWPERTDLPNPIVLTSQSDPNFGIRINRYARTTMTFVTDRAAKAGGFSNSAAANETLSAGTFSAHVALGAGQSVPYMCGLATDWICGEAPVTNDDAFVDPPVVEAVGDTVPTNLARVTAAARNHTILLFVHGYNNTFVQGADTAARLSYLMEPYAHSTIYYSWPSAAKLLGYAQDLKNAELSAVNLVRVLDTLTTGTHPPKIVLAAHSMGSYVLTSALYIWALKHPTKTNAFASLDLFAGDLDAALWEARRPEIARVVKRIKFYANVDDQALHVSECATGDNRPRIGQIASWRPPVVGFDATREASTNGFGHGYLVESTSVALDWNRTTNAPTDNRVQLVRTPWLADGGGSLVNAGKLTAEAICKLFANVGR
jgi:esterase/lipase superfamily enzyme